MVNKRKNLEGEVLFGERLGFRLLLKLTLDDDFLDFKRGVGDVLTLGQFLTRLQLHLRLFRLEKLLVLVIFAHISVRESRKTQKHVCFVVLETRRGCGGGMRTRGADNRFRRCGLHTSSRRWQHRVFSFFRSPRRRRRSLKGTTTWLRVYRLIAAHCALSVSAKPLV
jgi:hypothetical protein